MGGSCGWVHFRPRVCFIGVCVFLSARDAAATPRRLRLHHQGEKGEGGGDNGSNNDKNMNDDYSNDDWKSK